MHPVRIGRIVRTLRRRRGWRQTDLASRARVSQQAVSLVEVGQCRRLSIRTLERLLAQLEAEVEVLVRWRGGELEKVLDAGHARVEGDLATVLVTYGWLVELEVTYSIGGDRGSIDLLALYPGSGALLVTEIKTDVASADAMLRRHDEKVRLAAAIARARLGWAAESVSRLLVLPDASTARRRVRTLANVLDRVYPARGTEVRRWLRSPKGSLAGLLFLSTTNIVGDRRDLTSRRRVARPRHATAERGAMPSPAIPGFIDSTGEHQVPW